MQTRKYKQVTNGVSQSCALFPHDPSEPLRHDHPSTSGVGPGRAVAAHGAPELILHVRHIDGSRRLRNRPRQPAVATSSLRSIGTRVVVVFAPAATDVVPHLRIFAPLASSVVVAAAAVVVNALVLIVAREPRED